SMPSHGQQRPSSSTDAQGFSASAWRAIAHGKPSEAETLARARPTGDPAAAAVLGYLASRRGRYEEAIALLEPAATRAPLSDAALELGLLQQYLANAQTAAQILTPFFRQSVDGNAAAVLLRAGRAARALGRPREANALFRSAGSAGGANDPRVNTAW